MCISQCVLVVEVQSRRNVQCVMGSNKEEICHCFCLMYMDDLFVNLKECPTGPTGCLSGGTIVAFLAFECVWKI